MSIEDYFDPYDYNDYECEVTCRRCRAPGLHWQETLSGYRLFNVDDTLHVCAAVEDDEAMDMPNLGPI